jgi:hypothetical protein
MPNQNNDNSLQDILELLSKEVTGRNRRSAQGAPERSDGLGA